jgi:hypothetical protein
VGLLLDSGVAAIIDSKQIELKMITESPPLYQTSVEHMTDDQLRESIEELRHKRILRPISTRSKATKAPPMSEEDKQMALILKNKSPEEMLILQRKLGLID